MRLFNLKERFVIFEAYIIEQGNSKLLGPRLQGREGMSYKFRANRAFQISIFNF